MEIFGTLLALSGCMIIAVDPLAEKVQIEDNLIFYGNFLAFFSSIFNTLYIIFGQ
jgi:hypothetical protein